MSLSLLDQTTIDFIRRIKKEWNGVLSRSSTYEEKLKQISGQHEGMLKHMNSSLMKIKTLSEEASSAVKSSNENVEETSMPIVASL